MPPYPMNRMRTIRPSVPRLSALCRWISRRSAATVLAAACLFLTGPAAAAEVYKWTDEQGRVHYGARPPTGQDYESLKTQPGPTPGDTLRRLRERAGFGAATGTGGTAPDPAADPDEQRRSACLQARTNLETLQNYQTVTRLDPDGNQVPIGPEEKNALLEQTRKEVDFYCNS